MNLRYPRLSPPMSTRTRPRAGRSAGLRRALAICLVTALSAAGATGSLTSASAAPVGQGFLVTPADLAHILKQIKIAEAHVANTTSETGPCGALLGSRNDQVPDALTSYGLRTVDGSCNNLLADRQSYGAADQVFPRLTTPVFADAESVPAGFGPSAPTSYKQKSGSVFDSEPRVISNLIVDQTATNPAAVAAAGYPVRTQNAPGKFPCSTDPDLQADPPVEGVPAGCVPSGNTLFIPNVTTDVGLSPPYNSVFTLFGQFFDHGIDQTVKGGGTVFVPLRADDPLRTKGPDGKAGTGDEVPARQAFMVLTRAKNQPGPDGVRGTADDVQDALNTDSPYVDQSQTYGSHPSHQVFLREYALNSATRPVATGQLLEGAAGPTRGGMASWAEAKQQAAEVLGLKLSDADVLSVPQLAVDPYGRFLPGPERGLPQYVTPTGLVEGNLAAPVAVPANVVTFETPFLTDIAHHADPSPADLDHNPRTPPVAPTPDSDTTASSDFSQQAPGTYDDEMLDAHLLAGDGRVNENIGLTAIHQVFHSEHNRLAEEFKRTLTADTSAKGVAALAEWKLAAGGGGWNGERLFQAARFVTEMEYQHIVFEEFGRKIQPALQLFGAYHTDIDPAVKAEFAHAVYRFGHSMLTDTISRTNADGSDNSIGLLEGFLNPPSYTDGGDAGPLNAKQAAGSVLMGMSDQVGNELDEFVTETLRSNLLGLPLDLAAINLARARETGIPTLNDLRRQIHDKTGDAQLAPYTSWADFGQNVKHPQSVTNFVAAYGRHPSITSEPTLAGKRAAAKAIVDPGPGVSPSAEALDFLNSTGAYADTETGVNSVDLWVGGLAEKTNLFGGLLGSTFNYVFELQMTELQNADRFYYLARTPGMNLRAQLEGNSFAELMMRNTSAHSLKADAFGTADCRFQLSNLAGTAAGYAASGATVADDPASECDESALLLRKPDGTIQYRERNSVDPSGINGQSVFNGTDGVDRVTGGNDNDTFLGNDGDDVLEGQGGDDIALGGEGDDRISDSGGDDIHKGGPGDDYLNTGIGLDIVMGGEGQDFTNAGGNDNETFAGPGNDFVRAGDGADAVFGDDGDDWIQGGSGVDLLIGEHGAPFFDDPGQSEPGHDVLVGQVGDNDYDAEGGDDVMAANAATDRYAGAGGYDWVTHQYDTVAADDDMSINRNLLGAPLPVVVHRDRWQETEATSGSSFNDVLRGDDEVPSAATGAGVTGCDALDQRGIDRVSGLDELLPTPSTPLEPVEAGSAQGSCPLEGPVWGAGNILLGGQGNDTLEGRGADDVLDGDRHLKVRISVRDDAGTEIGSTDLMERPYQAGNPRTLATDVASGVIDPGNLVVVREVLTPSAVEVAGSQDSAVFSDVEANYTVSTTGGDGTLGSPGSTTTVVHDVAPDDAGDDGGAGGGGGRVVSDGTDTLRNIEFLVFADTTAPGVPVIGAATAGDQSATVSFNAPTAGSVTEFSVRVLDAGDAQVGELRTAAADARSLQVTGLTNGTAYRFQVRASNDKGDSDFSAPSNTVTPQAPPVVPSAPTIGQVTAGSASATVRWVAGSDGGAPVTGYQVEAFDNAGALVRSQSAPASSRSLVVTDLANQTTYTFQVRAVNVAGTGAASARSAAVTPRTEFVAPVVSTRTPVDGAKVVSQTGHLTAGFSEPVTGLSTRTFTLKLGSTAVPATVSFTSTGRTATLNPKADLAADRTYTATLSGLKDRAGNAMAATSWSFTTGPAPRVVRTTPASNAKGVRRDANLTVTFDEAITGQSSSTVRLTRVTGGGAVTAPVSLDAKKRVLTLNPSSSLAANTQYRVTVTGGATAVRDLAGNPAATRTWTFSTGSVR